MTGREKIAEAALKHTPSSPQQNIQVYTDVIIRPLDRNPQKITYFLGYNGRGIPSTCGLFALGVMRLAGVDDPILTNPYQIGNAITDVQNVGYHKGALVRKPGDVDFPLRLGDIAIIDNSGFNSHVVVLVGSPVVQPDGSVVVDTCEGGQAPTGGDCLKFSRKWVKKNGEWYLGSRPIFCYVDASKLGIDDADDLADELHNQVLISHLEHSWTELDESVGDVLPPPDAQT